ncbi:acyltransferase family protein [Rhizobium sp. FY34]|uniref:acyltransferase family protein n=1 Tax=Rhizobium sp. FY34 TaxID=2562309 RepID=UPI0010C1049B|nr:acyltransferase family protein [Rhizobium sp. FY34]
MMTCNGSYRRRHDFDLLRVVSFGTLIVYHASLMFGTKPWLIKSETPSRLMDLISVASHPWRMSLLFLLSGFVTSSSLGRKTVKEIRSARTRQLLLPFIVGVLLIVPPQVYLSDTNPFPDLSYWQFWKAYLISAVRLEHVWFLAYLWIYIFVWSMVWPRFEAHWARIASTAAALLKGPNLFLLPVVFLSLLRIVLYPVFGEVLIITHDVYAHVLYFSMFMAGVLLMNEDGFWQEIDRQRRVSCALAVISFTALAITVVAVPREQLSDIVLVAVRIVRSIFQWSMIITLLAFARRYATRPNRVVTYLNNSIMTYYVVHQTVLVVAAYYLSRESLLDVQAFVPVCIVTALTCAVIAEVKRLAAIYCPSTGLLAGMGHKPTRP